MVEANRPGARLSGWRRRRRACRSSWALEDLVLRLDDGSSVSLVWKDLGREAPGSGSRSVKPPRIVDPRREVWAYDALLADTGAGAPCWGTVSDAEAGIHWLFLESVPGVPLCEVGEREAWLEAAAWLGRFHARSGRAPDSAPLLRQDASLHRWWYRRARVLESRRGRSGVGGWGGPFRTLERLESAHRQALARVMALPPTILHGEFYPANVLVARTASGSRSIVPVDWEMVAVGPGVLDLAALCSGAWSEADRTGFAVAYRDAVVAAGAPCPTPEHLVELLDAALLLVSVQWLGWADDTWSPPDELRTDWKKEATRIVNRMRP